MPGIYSGIGSRTCPENVCKVMTEIATNMENNDWLLRSGGADGADSAFERGVINPLNKTIWNPRRGLVIEKAWAREEIKKHCWEYPFEKMTPFVQNLLVRNMYQILGETGDTVSDLVILWTVNPDPCHKDSGGSRYAARCGVAHGIKIHNLRNPRTLELYIKRNQELRK